VGEQQPQKQQHSYQQGGYTGWGRGQGSLGGRSRIERYTHKHISMILCVHSKINVEELLKLEIFDVILLKLISILL